MTAPAPVMRLEAGRWFACSRDAGSSRWRTGVGATEEEARAGLDALVNRSELLAPREAGAGWGEVPTGSRVTVEVVPAEDGWIRVGFRCAGSMFVLDMASNEGVQALLSQELTPSPLSVATLEAHMFRRWL